MSGGLVILLIIIVWLFVLAPLLLKGQRPISKAGEAFEDTRVVYSGEEGDLPARPQPRLGPDDVRRHDDSDAEAEQYEVVDAVEEDEILVDEPRTQPEPTEVVDGEVLVEEEDGSTAASALEEGGATAASAMNSGGSTAASVLLVETEDQAEEDTYESSDAYLTPEDLMHRGPASLSVVSDEAAEKGEKDTPALDVEAELEHEPEEPTEEDVAYAKSRAGRGGWDPERDRKYSSTRYQRRQRTLGGLAIAIVLTTALAAFVGTWAWLLPVVAVVLTVLYLVALRKQVQEEKALRQRRLRHLRRARLGVRSEEANNLNIPQQLRRHGSIVLELDDESPDFDYLPTTSADTLRPRDEHHDDNDHDPGRGTLRVS